MSAHKIQTPRNHPEERTQESSYVVKNTNPSLLLTNPVLLFANPSLLLTDSVLLFANPSLLLTDPN
jgi:hypothetical protein